MTQLLKIHPENPQVRLIDQVVTALKKEGTVIVYPTDSAYALGCNIGDSVALERIRRIRQLDKNHNFTLMCRDLSELGLYSHVDNPTFRLIKSHVPGAYTFILTASKEVPKRLQHPKRKTIGLRVPANNIALTMLECLRQPLMSVTLILPGETIPMADPEEIYDKLDRQVDVIVDGGFCGVEPTTVIDFLDNIPKVVRLGKGDVSGF